MKNKIHALIIIGLCSINMAQAINIENFITDIGDKINIPQINDCEKYYANLCKKHNSQNFSQSFVDKFIQQSKCIENKMKDDKNCQQSYIIRTKVSDQINTIIPYPNHIAVITTTFLADGQTGFYIVDSSGKIFSLTNESSLINSNKSYQLLVKQYPNLELTNSVHLIKPHNNQNPKYKNITNRYAILIFNQELKDAGCVACKTIALAKIAYIFNSKGIFYKAKLLKIKQI